MDSIDFTRGIYMNRKKAVVIGATGIAGQQFISALESHPYFEVVKLAASERNMGKTYRNALGDESGKINWFASSTMPSERILEIKLDDAANLDLSNIDVVFTAVESDVANELEPKYAEEKPVFSTASAFRYKDDVPLIIPSVNAEHVSMVELQKSNRNWKGYVLPIPNCTTTGLAASLKPLQQFGLEMAIMTSMQAVSGAGRNPGVKALDIVDNVVPYIPKEEEKVEKETLKILGKLEGERITNASTKISCTCTRVNVLDGHTETVFTKLTKNPGPEQVKKAIESHSSPLVQGLPCTPKQMFIVHEDPFRPQPRMDRDTNDGMTTHVGRLRNDPVLGGIKYVVLSHNTKLGAARGAIWVAELCVKKGYL